MPRRKYRLSIDIDFINEEVPCSLLRRSDLPYERTFTNLNTLREDAIDIDRVPYLSLNLLGSKFKDYHIKFTPKKLGANAWDGRPVYFIDYLKDYEEIDNCIPIYFALTKLHKQTYPYQLKDHNELKKIIRAFGKDVLQSTGGLQVNGRCEIKHSPTNLNYWHLELLLINKDGKAFKKAKNSTEESAAESALLHIISSAGTPKRSEVHPLRKAFYTA